MARIDGGIAASVYQRTPAAFVCETCDAPIEPARNGLRRYCGACSVDRRNAAARAKFRREKTTPDLRFKIPIYTCLNCKKTYRPKKGNRTTFCCRQCSIAYLIENRTTEPPSCKILFLPCIRCASPVAAKPTKKSIECKACSALPKVPKPRAPRKATALVTLRCVDCGQECQGTANRIRCNPCASRKSRVAYRAKHGRVRKHRERAKRYGVPYEPVNPIAVFDRDGWRCQLCKVKTPKRLRGTFEPNAPELDHIVPMSAGGEHSYRNTQCSCRKCNIAKSSTPRGQMRLFG